MSTSVISPDPVPDLSTCAQEQIHLPGTIQPRGLLFVLEEHSFRVLQVSENARSYFPADPLGQTIEQLFGRGWADMFAAAIHQTALERVPFYLGCVSVGEEGPKRSFHAVAHRLDGVLILELEFADSAQNVSFADLYPLVRTFMAELQQAKKADHLSMLAAREVRRITGFDRVLIYRFNPNWDGHVVAEDRSEEVASYLDLWFPASDIPAQARELYRVNRIRLISEVEYKAVPITPTLHPETKKPIDLSFSILRSVSPVHLEYLKNMGVGASMSISILRDGKLWGLIACHHRTERTVSYEIRTACDFLGQAFALQIDAAEQAAEYEQRLRLKLIESQLLAFMAQEEQFVDGLVKHSAELLQLMQARGAAILFNEECTLIGATPEEDMVKGLGTWLGEQQQNEVFYSSQFGEDIADDRYSKEASGVLAISISKLHSSYIIWFRPEVVQTVRWAGNPAKAVEQGSADGIPRLHPRKSFEAWQQTVRGKAIPWDRAELKTAADLRVSILEIVLRKAEELAVLTGELERSNKELEAFSYSVSHDLRAPFRHIVGYSTLLRERLEANGEDDVLRYVDTIIDSANSAGSLVDNLLHFAKIGRAALHLERVAQSDLVWEVQRELEREVHEREVEWQIGPLPTVRGDLVLLRLVWQNLLSNAVKYSRTKSRSEIQVGFEESEAEVIFFVRDNGVGFDSRYAHKLFGVFQRLHRMEDFEGNGIGLANVRRIVARHGGRTWAEGAIDQGATFYFSLPRESAQ